DVGVGDALDEAQPEQLERNAERNVLRVHRLREIRLSQRAARRIRTSLQGEKAVNASVAGSVRLILESRFAECAGRALKRRNRVGSSQAVSNRVGRIGGG